MCSTWIWMFMNRSPEAHMYCLLYRGKSICNAGFQGAHLVSCCSRVTASHFIQPTSDTREVWKLCGYSKVQVCSSWLGWRNSKDTKKSLSVNNNEHPWRKMTKHEQKSREQIMSHARTWNTRLFAQGWTGWTGWLARKGRSSRGPELDKRLDRRTSLLINISMCIYIYMHHTYVNICTVYIYIIIYIYIFDVNIV